MGKSAHSTILAPFPPSSNVFQASYIDLKPNWRESRRTLPSASGWGHRGKGG